MKSHLQSSWSILLQTVLGASCSVFLTTPASAIVDTNNNGLSDLWEKQYNNGALFDPTFDLQSDPDGDGWTNSQEAAAGTDPANPNPPDGFILPQITHIPEVWADDNNDGIPELVTPQAVLITWPTLPGKQYTLLFSPDLTEGSWTPVESPFIGTGNITEYGIPLTQPDGSTPDKLFWRTAVEDVDTDGDGFTDYEEHQVGSDPDTADSDADGLPDDWEILHGFNRHDDGSINPVNGANGDPDEDGLLNVDEYWFYGNPHDSDTDDDGLGDFDEAWIHGTDLEYSDTDGDDLTDGEEINIHLTDPLKWDTDDDSLADNDELLLHGTNPSKYDTDDDTLPDNWEIDHDLNPILATGDHGTAGDPDGDGLANSWEMILRLHPRDSDSNDNGIADGAEDPDKDSLGNLAEITIHFTNPVKYDTDGDALPDYWEIDSNLNPNDATGTNGTNGDSDNDGLGNFHEWLNNSNPHDADSDDDGADDLTEVNQGSDPNDTTDGGNPPEDEIKPVNFKAYGDYASWRMKIRGDGPRDRRTMFVVTPAVGVPETGSIKLRRNNKYKITLHHTGSKEDEEETWYCWEAGVDGKPQQQTFPNYQPGRIPDVADFFTIADGHWLVDNRDGLFTAHNHRTEEDGGNASAGLEATLLPVDIAVRKKGDVVPPNGVLALSGDIMEFALAPSFFDAEDNFENQITWQFRQRKADGTYEGWGEVAIIGQQLTGSKFECAFVLPGIYQVKAVIANAGEYEYKRKKDEKIGNFEYGPGKKGQPDCIGICSGQIQLDICREAQNFYGSEQYAASNILAAQYGFPEYPASGNSIIRCNIFVAHRATAAGAVVPKINGFFNEYPPLANEWAGIEDTSIWPGDPTYIANWPILPPGTHPQPGCIIAHPQPGDAGHCAITDYDGEGIGAGISGTVNKKYEEFWDGTSRIRKYQP